MALLILFALLTILSSLYLFLSPRDTVTELKAIFDPRIIRRGMRIRKPKFRFSILSVVQVTLVLALLLALLNTIEVPVEYWPGFFLLLVLFLAISYALYCVISYVGYDLSMKGQRRQQPDTYLRSEQPRGVMPKINAVDMHPIEDPNVNVTIHVED